MVMNTLRQWKLSCPRRDTGKWNENDKPIRELDLVFPNGAGKIESLANIINRGLVPVQLAALTGLTGHPTLELFDAVIISSDQAFFA